MSFVAVAIGVGTVGGVASSLIGSSAAKDAANIQAQSAANALNFQKDVFNQNQANYQQAYGNLTPFITAGQGATNTLSQLANGNYSSFTNSPDYNFALQQGTRGVTNYENAQGMGLSGGALKDISQFNQGLATQQYGNYFNRLMQIATLGGNAASGGLNSAVGFANSNNGAASNIGNTTQAIGQAQASGVVGSANALMGGINGLGNNALLGSLLNKNPSAYGNIGSMPATGAGSPNDLTSNMYAMSQGINPFG
jgi:hypothetical protein